MKHLFILLIFISSILQTTTVFSQATSSVKYTDDSRYGYFEARNGSNKRGFYLGWGNGKEIVDFRIEEASKLFFSGGDFYLGGHGNGKMYARHINGKDYKSPNVDHLYLNYGTGKHVYVGKWGDTKKSNLYINGDVYSRSGWFRTYGQRGLYSQSYGLHFYPISANYWRIRSNRGLEVYGKDNKRKGVLYHNNAGAFGLLDGDGNWGLLMDKDKYTQIRINNAVKLDINNSRSKVIGNLEVTGNIGVNKTNPTAKLHVNGTVRVESTDGNIPMLVEKGIDIVPVGSIPDYVFKDEYQLKSLNELEDFINTYNHLPGVVGENDIKENDGKVEIASFTYSLLEKIEELTLYTIQQQKEIDSLKDLIKATQK